MSESVNLPALGESVTEGTVTRWLKNVGDRVEVDEVLVGDGHLRVTAGQGTGGIHHRTLFGVAESEHHHESFRLTIVSRGARSLRHVPRSTHYGPAP